MEEAKVTNLDHRPFWCYNCRNCSISCVKSLSAVEKLKLELVRESCSSVLCSCPAVMHSIDDFEYSWSLVKERKTVKAIKEEFGFSNAMPPERMLAKLQQDFQELKLKASFILKNAATALHVTVSHYLETLKGHARDTCRINTLDKLRLMMINLPEDVGGNQR